MLPDDRKRRSRLFGWWYITIGVGFVLLAVNRVVIGDRSWSMVLRWLIAAGFLALGYFEVRRS
jgi:fatty acid desaturase